jgi:hypothetical protein
MLGTSPTGNWNHRWAAARLTRERDSFNGQHIGHTVRATIIYHSDNVIICRRTRRLLLEDDGFPLRPVETYRLCKVFNDMLPEQIPVALKHGCDGELLWLQGHLHVLGDGSSR